MASEYIPACRQDPELASSSSGLQLSPTSPSSSGKLARGRGRGRTRGRGSTRVVASDERAVPVKPEEGRIDAVQSISDFGANANAAAVPQLKAEADALDAATPMAATLHTELPSGNDAAAAAMSSAAHSPAAEVDPNGAPLDSLQQAAAAPAALPPPQASTPMPQAAAMMVPAVTASLKTSESFAEEDDYDADE